MTQRRLEEELRAQGVDCTVDTHGTLAVIVPSRGLAQLAEPSRRREVVALCAAHGFTHAALELPADGPGDEALPRN